MTNNTTECDRCLEEVSTEDIGKCETCEWDGLCPECLTDHNCYQGESQSQKEMEIE